MSEQGWRQFLAAEDVEDIEAKPGDIDVGFGAPPSGTRRWPKTTPSTG